MNPHKFFTELKRRNVYKVAVAYGIVAWLLIQVTDIVLPRLNLPEWSVTLVIALVLLSFPIALLLAWAFELTPEGIKRTEDVASNEAGTPRRRGRSTVLIVVAAVLAMALLAYNFTRARKLPATTGKSIAVLPLVNQ